MKGDGINFREFANFFAPLFYRAYSPEEIKDAFDKFDKDHSGYITANEFQDVLKRMGSNYSYEDVKNMIKAIVVDGGEKISLTDFTLLLS